MFVRFIAGSCDLTTQPYRDAVARLVIAVAIRSVSARNHERQWRLYLYPITGHSSMLLSIFERISIVRTDKCLATRKRVHLRQWWCCDFLEVRFGLCNLSRESCMSMFHQVEIIEM